MQWLMLTGTASMTMSTSDRSSILVVVVRRPLVAVASSFDILSFATSFSSNLSAGTVSHKPLVMLNMDLPANFKPLSMDACEVSTKVTGTPAFCAATKAIPRPFESQQSSCL